MPRYRYLAALFAALALAALAAACDPGADPETEVGAPDAEPGTPAAPEPDDAEPDRGYAEAPVLAELVEAGELPPVDERLPASPMVVEPVDRVGVYGGTWNSAILGPADGPWWTYRSIGYDQLTRWDLEFSEIQPNIAERFEVNDDATEFTFHLREGMRWSDGEPFTAHDIVFWWEAYAANPELSGDPPTWMVTGGEPGSVEAVDDHTVVFSFAGAPNGLLTQRLATPLASDVAAMPRHYLERFHADYNPDIDAVVAEDGAADWVELFDLKAKPGTEFQTTVGLPSLRAWVITTEIGDGPRVTYERNPYYWKVDPDGQQLPYVDNVVYDVVEDDEVILLKALNGELHMHSRHITGAANRPVLHDHRESGNYDFYAIRGTGMNTMSIQLNLTHKDPVLREIIQNKDFRIGLSHAINRQEIIDVVHVGQGFPHQLAPRPDSDFYNEELATQYTEHDVELADQHLDAAGYSERDGAGFRLGPDGQRIVLNVDVDAGNQGWLDMLELIEGYWAEVGVEMHINAMDRSLLFIRTADNDHDAAVWGGDSGGGMAVILDPRHYFPSNLIDSWYAIEWVAWYHGDARGQEPEWEVTREQMALYDRLLSTPDPDEQIELMHEILELAVEAFYGIGISLDLEDGYGLVRNDFHNVPKLMPGGFDFPNPGPAMPEQYFIEG